MNDGDATCTLYKQRLQIKTLIGSLHCDNCTVYINNACGLQNTAALKLMSRFLPFSVWSLILVNVN